MNTQKWKFFLLYEWLVSALPFWMILACVETTMAAILNSFSPPIGSGSLPSLIDLHFFVAALSIYALLSIPTALILIALEKVFSWLKEKTKFSFLDYTRMDFYLMLGWGFLCFKWIAHLIPFLTHHLPKKPYLLIIPFLLLQMYLSGRLKKNKMYYQVQWVLIVTGTIFLSKTAYDTFIGSSLSIVTRLYIFLLFAGGALFIGLLFYRLLHRIILSRVKPRLAYTLLFTLCLSGGCIFTLDTFHTSRDPMHSLTQPITSQEEGSEIAKNVIIVVVDCLRADHLGCYGYTRDTSPFLDSIARSGIIFENCIASSSWTIPSVVSFLPVHILSSMVYTNMESQYPKAFQRYRKFWRGKV